MSNSTKDEALQQIHICNGLLGLLLVLGRKLAATLSAAVLEERFDALVAAAGHGKVYRVKRGGIIKAVVSLLPLAWSALDNLHRRVRPRVRWSPPHCRVSPMGLDSGWRIVSVPVRRRTGALAR